MKTPELCEFWEFKFFTVNFVMVCVALDIMSRSVILW